MSKTGFYRTTTYKKNDKEYFKYTIKNKLIFKKNNKKGHNGIEERSQKTRIFMGDN